MIPESRDLTLQSKGRKSEHHFLSSLLYVVVAVFYLQQNSPPGLYYYVSRCVQLLSWVSLRYHVTNSLGFLFQR